MSVGYLTITNWRWCFAINLPVCVAAIILIFFLLRKELLGPQPIPIADGTTERSRRARFGERLMTIDAGGQLLFLFGFGLLVLALTWAGATYSWDSAYVLAPLIIGTVLIGVFAFYEKLMRPGEGFLSRRWPTQQAMIPWKLIANRDVGLMFYISVCTGASMYSVGRPLSNSLLSQLTPLLGPILRQPLLHNGQAIRCRGRRRATTLLHSRLSSGRLTLHDLVQCLSQEHLLPRPPRLGGRSSWGRGPGVGAVQRAHA